MLFRLVKHVHHNTGGTLRNPRSALELLGSRNLANELLIGDLLMRAGVIDADGLTRAREVQKNQGVSLPKALSIAGLAAEQTIYNAIAQSLHLDLLTDDKVDVLPEVLALLPGDFCRKRLVAPLSLKGKSLRVAFADPSEYSVTQDVEFRSGKHVVAVVASDTVLRSLLDRFYPEDLSTGVGMQDDPGGQVEALEDCEFEVLDATKWRTTLKCLRSFAWLT